MKRYIKNLDFSGATVSWNVNNETRTHTLLGSFFSVASIATLMYITWVFGNDMIYKYHPTVNTEDLSFSSRPTISLNKETFPIAITCQDYRQVNFLDPNLFKIDVIHNKVFNSNSTTIETKQELIPCTYEHFPSFSKEYLEVSGMLNYLCVKDQDVSISGYFDEASVQFFSILISPCINSSKFDKCAPIEDIKYLLDNNPTPLTLSIYLKVSIINTLDYETPISSYMLNVWESIQLGTRITTTLFVREDMVLTDSNILQKQD